MAPRRRAGAEHLVVWLGRERAGTLTRGRRGGVRFERAPAGPLLTIAPEGAELEWPAGFARAWFDNLLPEDERRSAAEHLHSVDRGDTFGLLAAIGWECAGAVSILPEGIQPLTGSYVPLSEADVLDQLDALPRTVVSVDREARMSLGGVQEKLLLARTDTGWAEPVDGAVSTHILKPEPDRYPGLAVAEAWSLHAAGAATPSAHASLLEVPGHRATVVVERYDRVLRGGGIERIHQEDLCQVLGLPPEAKYPRSEGPREPTLERLSAILVARAADVPEALSRLLEQVTLTIALGDTDAHAKNISLLHEGGGTVSVAPFYDAAPTLYFLPTTRRAAMPVAGKWRIDEITAGHLVAEARSWGMPEAAAERVIARTLERFMDGMQDASERYPGMPSGARAVVEEQVARLRTGI